MAETDIHAYSAGEKLNKMDVDLIELELTTTAATHANGDVIATAEVISDAFSVVGGSAIIQSIVLLNTDDSVEAPALTLVFGNDNTSIGTIGSAPDITDANLINWCMGCVDITNWKTILPTGNEVATKTNVGLVVKGIATSRNLYVNVINTSGGDYTPSATGVLRMVIGIVKD